MTPKDKNAEQGHDELGIDMLDDDICKYCLRQIPHKDMKTKHGCIWCDYKFWKKKNKEKK